MISASPSTPSLTGCQSPKTVKYDQVFLKPWSRANTPPLSVKCPFQQLDSWILIGIG
jgi:hypothetical protein